MIQENILMTEREALSKLTRQRDLYLPLEIVSVKGETKTNRGLDVGLTISWRQCRANFIASVNTRTAPKLIKEGLRRLNSRADKRKQNLLLIVPFLSKTILEMLEQEGLSGLDLNGNYLIQSPTMTAIRLDRKNQFKESQPIKKIFSANSSLVGRLFLSSKKSYTSVNEVCSAIRTLGGRLSLSAVSKILKGLENELIIKKDRAGIVLIQPDKLLQRLEEDYRPPKVMTTMRLKIPDLNRLQNFNKLLTPSVCWIVSGESSVQRYDVTTPSEIFMIYTRDLESLAQYENERFYNIILKKTEDSFPYFDAREYKRVRWASPVQCYLELSKLDKREKELAGNIRQALLENLK